MRAEGQKGLVKETVRQMPGMELKASDLSWRCSTCIWLPLSPLKREEWKPRVIIEISNIYMYMNIAHTRGTC